MISVHGQDQVVLLPVLGEVFSLVIDDMICSKGAHHFQVPGTAHRGDFSPKRFSDLHGKSSHTTRGAINQNLLPWMKVSFVAQTLQGGHRRFRYSRSLFER